MTVGQFAMSYDIPIRLSGFAGIFAIWISMSRREPGSTPSRPCCPCASGLRPLAYPVRWWPLVNDGMAGWKRGGYATEK